MMCKKMELAPVGTRFNKLAIVEDLGMMIKPGTKNKYHYVKCLCDCGNETIVKLNSLKTGRTQSCGCKYGDGNRNDTRKFNDYIVYGETVFVKFTNTEKYFLCDLEDWEKLKQYVWLDDGKGYAITSYENKTFLGGNNRFHRIVTNCPDDMVPDHLYPVSMGVCDNRKKNLQIKTQRENALNRGMFSHNTSGYKGVSKKGDKYESQIRVNGKYIYLGRYDDIEEAAEAYEKASNEYFGEFRRENIKI